MIPAVTPGNPATWTMPLDRRYLRSGLICQAVNYTGGVGLATTKITGGGNNAATATPTIVNGQVTAAAVVAGGAGYTTGDTITLVDATGTGCVLTVTAAAGAVTALAVTNGGTASPINPGVFFDYVRLKVNSKTIRDITPSYYIMRALAVGFPSALGELPIDFVEANRNFVSPNDSTAWDCIPGGGVTSFNFEVQVNKNMISPVLGGWMEFDTLQNALNVKGQNQRFQNPIKYRQISENVPAAQYDMTKLPKDEPIQRIWIIGSTPGSLTRVELIADNVTRLEAYPVSQALQSYRRYGFNFGLADYLNRNIGSNATLQGQFNPLNYFDAAFLPDVDGRLSDALPVTSELILRLTSSVAQTVNVVVETAPGAFK